MNFFKLFLAFFKIGFFTIGGGYAMLPLIQKEVVDVNGWLDEEEFIDAIAISQSSPGAVAVNISVFIGYRLGGFLGAIVSTLGTVMPSVMIILVVAIFLYQYKDIALVEKVFLGVRPAVVSLIASSVVLLAKGLGFSVERVVLAVTSFVLIVFLDISPIFVILGGGFITGIYYNLIKKDEKTDNPEANKKVKTDQVEKTEREEDLDEKKIDKENIDTNKTDTLDRDREEGGEE